MSIYRTSTSFTEASTKKAQPFCSFLVEDTIVRCAPHGTYGFTTFAFRSFCALRVGFVHTVKMGDDEMCAFINVHKREKKRPFVSDARTALATVSVRCRP